MISEELFHDIYPDGGDATFMLPNGVKVLIILIDDQSAGPPWVESDGHGVVERRRESEVTADRWRALGDYSGDYPRFFYDMEASLSKAMRQDWGEGKYSQAVEDDFLYLHAWMCDEWRYVGMTVSLLYEGVLLAETSLWGLEYGWRDWKTYFAEVAKDLLVEATEDAKNRQVWLVTSLLKLTW